MKFDKIFEWDGFSDQPYPIKDKRAKKSIYRLTIIDTLKMVVVNIVLFPIILVIFFFTLFKNRKNKINSSKFFGMGVDINCDLELIRELGVDNLLVRVPLSDIKNINKYKLFIDKLDGYRVIVNILQDRTHIENRELLKSSITTIFKTLNIKEYQIGNAINRKKWAFFTMDEYMLFYKIVQDIRDSKFKDISLIGSSVIDFEYYFSVRTLFNFHKIYYDKFSSLLYVDRRGSPENLQMGLDLIKKIKLLYSMVILSPKSSNKIVITETNWPISNSAPYAPTSEKECVGLDDYSLYMVQYYLMALSTGMVETVYWHQLIAPGYGLVDNRNGIKKYPAFDAYKTMVFLLKGAKLVEFDFSKEIKYMKFKSDKIIEVYWSNREISLENQKDKLLSLYGTIQLRENFLYRIRDDR